MLEMRRDFALALEARDHHVAGELWREDLDNHLAVQRQIRSQEEPTHTTPPHLFFDAIDVGEALSQSLSQILHVRRKNRQTRRWDLGAHGGSKHKVVIRRWRQKITAP